jgi:hypothetical protein
LKPRQQAGEKTIQAIKCKDAHTPHKITPQANLVFKYRMSTFSHDTMLSRAGCKSDTRNMEAGAQIFKELLCLVLLFQQQSETIHVVAKSK